MQIEKEEIKLPLCKHDMVVYLESCKGSTEKLLELINEFSKIARYKINVRKLIFPYTSNEHMDIKLSNTMPFQLLKMQILICKSNKNPTKSNKT